MRRSAAPSKRKTLPSQTIQPDAKAVKHSVVSDGDSEDIQCFRAVYRAPQFKKHKTWDGDGFVIKEANGSLKLKTQEGEM